MKTGFGQDGSNSFSLRHVEFALSIGHLQFCRQLENINLELTKTVNINNHFSLGVSKVNT